MKRVFPVGLAMGGSAKGRTIVIVVLAIALVFVLAASASAAEFGAGMWNWQTDYYSWGTPFGWGGNLAGPRLGQIGANPATPGVHGGYATTTAKCGVCHSVHRAGVGGVSLMLAATVRANCVTCHDGTGGLTVYGVIEARTGWDPTAPGVGGAAHRIEVAGSNMIPGGNSDGTTRTATFSGPGGTLTCSDCHSPHDTGTVDPFLGERWRSVGGTPTVTSSHLLRRRPVGGLLTTTVYGTDWCLSCHAGKGNMPAPPGSAFPVNHPVSRDISGWRYDRVNRFVSPGVMTPGTLGQSNAGYVMPNTGAARPAPICQQCHEDSRRAGLVRPAELDASEVFRITQPDGHVATDNPRFQTFPHESLRGDFVAIEDVDPAGNAVGGDALCIRCHVMRR